ncbi:Asx homology domain-containing protein [Mycena leptocephala]|nr:Asx homology domain-containing protein [Mycena leptocephala]
MADDSNAPRRSNRKPKPTQREAIPVAENVPSKRKAKDDVNPAEQLRFMLQNPKSRLTKMIYLCDLINANSWNMLSPDSQSRLAALLPPTAFPSFQPLSVRPSRSSRIDEHTSLFTDAHFLAAAHTLQDHIYSNWLSDTHVEKVKKYEQGIKDGSLAAPWKDEVWERDNQKEESRATSHANSSSTRAGEAAELKLVDLAKSSVLREGDILAYKRNFTNLDIIVEKDVIWILDVDGQVDRTKRPNGNAWKSLTLWRWTGDSLEYSLANNERRGGREDHGTLFYLRACYYQDR